MESCSQEFQLWLSAKTFFFKKNKVFAESRPARLSGKTTSTLTVLDGAVGFAEGF
jgi:hypothetical protein